VWLPTWRQASPICRQVEIADHVVLNRLLPFQVSKRNSDELHETFFDARDTTFIYHFANNILDTKDVI